MSVRKPGTPDCARNTQTAHRSVSVTATRTTPTMGGLSPHICKQYQKLSPSSQENFARGNVLTSQSYFHVNSLADVNLSHRLFSQVNFYKTFHVLDQRFIDSLRSSFDLFTKRSQSSFNCDYVVVFSQNLKSRT